MWSKTNGSEREKNIAFAAGLLTGAGYRVKKYKKEKSSLKVQTQPFH